MKRTIGSLLMALVTLAVITACSSGPQPVEITQLATYTDDALKFEVQYPENWVTAKTLGQRFTVFSSNDAKPRFSDFATTGFPGAMIDVFASTLDSTKTLDSVVSASKRFDASVYKQSNVTVDGVQGIRLDYSFPLEDGDFKGVFIAATNDDVTYTTLKIEAFADAWTTYADNFDKIIASLKLAQTQNKTADTLNVVEELPFPSDTLAPQKGNGFTIQVPKNFYLGKANAANTIASYNYIGDRRGDCNIQIDVLDGSKTKELSSAATELASKYPGSPKPSATKVAGTNGYQINYNATKDVKSRVYFAKHGDKIFRITMNWYVPEAANYLPIFEKSFNTLHFE
jgi:hypothetical protein